jgi:hypothetical protein
MRITFVGSSLSSLEAQGYTTLIDPSPTDWNWRRGPAGTQLSLTWSAAFAATAEGNPTITID